MLSPFTIELVLCFSHATNLNISFLLFPPIYLIESPQLTTTLTNLKNSSSFYATFVS